MARSQPPRALWIPGLVLCVLPLLVVAGTAHAQVRPGVATPAAAAIPTPPTADPLGRETPRGTVLAFLNAARKDDRDLASQYLNVRPGQQDAGELAEHLFVVLDARLSAAGLPLLSGAPEGSRVNPLAPDEERIGTIRGPDGPVDIVLERVTRPRVGAVWLFSRKTLDRIPDLYDDVAAARMLRFLPRFLTERRVAGVRVFDWLAMVLGLTALYFSTTLLNRGLTWLAGWVRARVSGRKTAWRHDILPLPARLLILAVLGHWLLRQLELSLRVRQLLSNVAAPVAIGVIVWLGFVLAREIEEYVCRRIPPANAGAGISLVRVGRRLLDAVIIIAGIVAILRVFGIDSTPVLAGLGVGGLAVALAAQKTLENMIAGASLIFDQAVRVGDFLKIGTIEGTVDYIGLRSTRIRTLDRTVVSVPNGQIATMTLETLSERDKFWFHPIVGLRYETTTDQMRLVLDGIRQLLARQAEVDGPSIRVRFLRLNTFSLDVEVFAYVFARDWPHFLEIQESLLLRITEIVAAAGTGVAFPTHTMYVERGAPQP